MEHNPILVEAWRGDRVESRHHGAVAVFQDKKLRWSKGDIDRYYYPRSALKPFQALPVISHGIAEKLKLSGEDIALLLASHSGEPIHTDRVKAILGRADFSMADLECGVHEPYHKETALDLIKKGEQPCPLHNNCSGKHCGMLMLAQDKKLPHKNYIAPEHGVQKEIAQVIEKFCDIKLPPAGVDGCSAPTYALPLRNMAFGLMNLAGAGGDDNRAAALLLQEAMAHPLFVAGHGRHCTKVMTAHQGKVFAKVGAEGFYAVMIPSLKIGVAMKIDDGAERAVQILLNGVLTKLGLPHADLPTEKPLKSFRGLPAGRIKLVDGF